MISATWEARGRRIVVQLALGGDGRSYLKNN
jgi:hypothetical protein